MAPSIKVKNTFLEFADDEAMPCRNVAARRRFNSDDAVKYTTCAECPINLNGDQGDDENIELMTDRTHYVGDETFGMCPSNFNGDQGDDESIEVMTDRTEEDEYLEMMTNRTEEDEDLRSRCDHEELDGLCEDNVDGVIVIEKVTPSDDNIKPASDQGFRFLEEGGFTTTGTIKEEHSSATAHSVWQSYEAAAQHAPVGAVSHPPASIVPAWTTFPVTTIACPTRYVAQSQPGFLEPAQFVWYVQPPSPILAPAAPNAGVPEQLPPPLPPPVCADSVPNVKAQDGLPTTVMMKNLPGNLTQRGLRELLDSNQFNGLYDFMYLPIDLTNKGNLGYAFINFSSHGAANRFYECFEHFSSWTFASEKVCSVRWSKMQGHEVNVDNWRNSPIMHPDVAEEHKPLVFKWGMQVAFPPPTKNIRPPHKKDCRHAAARSK